MNAAETIALLTTTPTDAEPEEWFSDAEKGYHKARLIEQTGIDHYRPESERLLRLIFTLRKERGQLLFDPNKMAAASADVATEREQH